MPVVKLDTTDAFYVVDLEGAPRSVGVVRLAPKVLVDGAELLARATTYAYAVFGVQAGGASAGVNARPEGRDDAVTAFCEAVAPLVASGQLHLTAGTGLADAELSPLALDPLDDALAAGGAVTAARAFATGTAGVAGPAAPAWAERLGALWADGWNGAVDLDAGVDVLFLAGRAGFVDDEAAAGITARVLVPVTPVPVTAKAYAALTRRGSTFVPDALSCAAPLLAVADPAGGDPVERVAAMAAELAAAGGEPWREAVARAETFLGTWRDQLPFGRPLA